jgi:hypothetical protein
MDLSITLHADAVAAILAQRGEEDRRSDEAFCRAWAIQCLRGRLSSLVEQHELEEARKARGPTGDMVA